VTELKQAPRMPQATAMVVGTIIGASIFVQPSESAFGLLIVGIGWPVYLVWTAMRKGVIARERRGAVGSPPRSEDAHR
jgi:amino acid permease